MRSLAQRKVPSFRLSIRPPELSEVIEGIEGVLSSGQLTLGVHTKQLEQEFAHFVGMPFACAVSSGTAALEIALRTFGVEGKDVLVPTNTFFATAAAVLHAGGTPRFVDCDPRTLGMDYNSLVQRWSPECAGVIVVHIGGPVAPGIEAIRQFCRERGLFLLEDAAHSHGSSLHGKMAGSFGDAAAFSFYPTKVMTSGEGGMIVTTDEGVYREAMLYRDQGKESFSSNYHVRLGYNWRMSELHAVLGRSQLKSLPSNISQRRDIARWYDLALRDLPEVTPTPLPPGSESNYYKYPVLVPQGLSRDLLKQRIKDDWGVSMSGEVYALPCHRQPVFERYADSSFPGADQACAGHICLPLFPGLTRDEAEYVVEALHAVVSGLKEEVSH